MDFVPVTYSREEKRRARKSTLKMLGTGGAFVGQLPLLMAVGIGGDWIFGSFMMAVGGGLFTTIMALAAPDDRRIIRKRARVERIRALVNDHYGLNLNPDQFAALSYPETDPGSEFQAFGSIKVQDQVDGANFVERTIYLTATEGEMKLSESRDGKRFKELKPVRRALEGSSAPKALDEAHPSETLKTLSAPVGVSA